MPSACLSKEATLVPKYHYASDNQLNEDFANGEECVDDQNLDQVGSDGQEPAGVEVRIIALEDVSEVASLTSKIGVDQRHQKTSIQERGKEDASRDVLHFLGLGAAAGPVKAFDYNDTHNVV
jgi:hypothetical protein